MSGSPTKQGWALTPGALHRLLDRLDPSAERAGERYEELRRRLVWYFEMRGAYEASELADETMNRVARRLHDGAAVGDVAAYAHGVARMILLESLRRQAAERAAREAALVAFALSGEGEDEVRWSCLDACLADLPTPDRELILEYYRDEDGAGRIDVRKGLAERLGIPSPLLRSRTFRIRERLEVCVFRCLGQPGGRGLRADGKDTRGKRR